MYNCTTTKLNIKLLQWIRYKIAPQVDPFVAIIELGGLDVSVLGFTYRTGQQNFRR